MRVLIVEDEKKLANALVQILAADSMTADAVYTGTEGLDNALTGIYDVIVLDIMLPGMDGISVLKGIRKEGITTPVLMFTAKDDLSDKVTGLDSGADDYLTKPFAAEELKARIRALGRRSTSGILSGSTLSHGDLTLDLKACCLCCGNNRVKLALKELSVMELLMKNSDAAVSKDMLITRIWGYDSEAEDNNVEVYISFLRKKLSFLKSKVIIRTMRGIGYMLTEEV